jgi:hypothetical protein|nr:MAG TPA: terminase small subunit [Caudoviricetes sp.]
MANVKYNPEYHDQWAWSLAIRGCTDQEIADAMNLSRRTIARWKKEHESFAQSLETGKDPVDAAVEKSLFDKCKPQIVKESRRILEIGRDGVPKPARVEETDRYIPADTTALIFWLKNRRPEEWRDRPKVSNESIFNRLDEVLASIESDF